MRLLIVAIVATLFAQIQGALAHLTLAVLANEAAPDYGLSPELIGLYAGLMFVAAALGCLASTGLNLRHGGIRTTQIALASSAAGLALLLVPHWAALIPSALLIGAGYGPLTVSSSHILARAAPPGMMALVFSVKQTGVPIGYAAAGILLPPLALAFGWRGAVLTAALASVALILAIQPTRRSLDTDRGSGGTSLLSLEAVLGPLRMVRASPGLRRMTIASVVFAGTQIGVASFFVVYMQSAAELDLQRAGLVLAVANILAIFGRIAWGHIADRTGAGQTIIAGLGLGMAASIGVALLITPAWPYVALLVLGAAMGLTVLSWNGVFVAETARQAPAGRVAEATGGVLTIMYCGMVICPAALTLMFSALDSYFAGFLVLVIIVATVSTTFLVRPLPPASKAPPAQPTSSARD